MEIPLTGTVEVMPQMALALGFQGVSYYGYSIQQIRVGFRVLYISMITFISAVFATVETP